MHSRALRKLGERDEKIFCVAAWREAARHFDEKALAALVLSIGVINLWNRLNAATRQPSGEWTARYV
jgi:alkylhydroperoxidase family enzyme